MREELRTALRGWNALQTGDGDDQALISSGRLDSSALFELSLWIETRLGRPLDPSTFSVARDWDTPGRILAFIERARAGAVPERVPGPQPAAARPRALHPKLGGIEFAPWSPGHRDAIAHLQKRLWSGDSALNRRFFEWRYERNPVGGPPLIWLAFAGDRAVAMRGAFASRWQAGHPTAEYTCYLSDDLVVLPEYENRGIFAALNERFHSTLEAQGHKFFLSLSALRVTRMQSLAEGALSLPPMEPVGRLSGTARLCDAARRLARPLPLGWRLARLVAPGERASRAFTRFDQARSPRGPAGFALVGAATPRPREMAELIERLGHDGRIRQRRDGAWFAWRYQSPLHEYRFLFAEGARGLAGYLVLERPLSELANPRRIHIAEWEADSPALLDALLDAALNRLRAPEVVAWTRTAGTDRQRALQEAGFAPVDPEQTARGLPSFLVWPLAGSAGPDVQALGGRSLLDLGDWDVRIADTSLG
ncbi:MAG: hypothetical protein ACT4UP_05355 [Gammaproteobacteria bacterium]